MSNIQVLFPERIYMHSFGIFGFACTSFCFSFHFHKTKILIAFKNKVIRFWQAKVENKGSKKCLPPALLEIKWIFYRWERRETGR